MARRCSISGKGPMSGNNRSHALNATKRTFGVNLQKVTVIENGQKKKIKVSAKTAKTLKKKGLVA
ncbi:50S ribosomal protein L28 [Mycoplasma marinum]|uniref:Large ribosomal subunit protein bL28 n=1 Tax=Mycoplasma marinum TaxID=1937190 RepID=A0A4R0XW64_9MOLU|nr:50S ribosomal protein L28 [Mycoplasma marinum]TCG12057.1 50S ribosomal protein L28 [Mycoplasma marinum]